MEEAGWNIQSFFKEMNVQHWNETPKGKGN